MPTFQNSHEDEEIRCSAKKPEVLSGQRLLQFAAAGPLFMGKDAVITSPSIRSTDVVCVKDCGTRAPAVTLGDLR
jgi:hypothetical protein